MEHWHARCEAASLASSLSDWPDSDRDAAWLVNDRTIMGPCATMSTLAYNRTSRSLHFPFASGPLAVCTRSGAQPGPEILSLGRLSVVSHQ
jgi:hypothetical protein